MTMRQPNMLRRLGRDEDGNLMVVSALFIMVLVIMLTVSFGLSRVVSNKIRAQNAADAAAITAAIWQVRGNHFVQELNNLVYYSDTAAFASLGVAAACGVTTVVASATVVGAPVAAAANIAGNIALGFTIFFHASSQFILIPFRHLGTGLFPAVCYLGASEMAQANYATSIGGLPRFAARLGLEVADYRVGEEIDKVADEIPLVGDEVKRGLDEFSNAGFDFLTVALGGIATDVLDAAENIPLYAIGFRTDIKFDSEADNKKGDTLTDDPVSIAKTIIETGKKSLLSLHLESQDWLTIVSEGKLSEKATEVFGQVVDHLGDFAMTGTDGVDEVTVEVIEGVKEEGGKMIGDAVDEAMKGGATEIVTVPPLLIGNKILEGLLALCKPLVMEKIASPYFDAAAAFNKILQKGLGGDFKDKSPKWNHAWHETETEMIDNGRTKLPVSTWVTVVREGNGGSDGAYARLTSAWRPMGGLGVRTERPGEVTELVPDGSQWGKRQTRQAATYGDLGAVGLASAQAYIDPVVMFRPGGMRGWVQIVPVVIPRPNSDEPPPVNSLDLGICH